MSGEEEEKEYELKDLIVQTLELNGLLPKIKAQIRASVFMALDETEQDRMKNTSYHNSTTKKLLNKNEGQLAAALVKEFLEKCELDYTLSVYEPELNSTLALASRDILLSEFKITQTESNRNNPILVELLSNGFNKSKPSSNELSTSHIDAVKSKFDFLDLTNSGFLEIEKVKDLFMNLFPLFSRSVIEVFVEDEIDKVDYDKLKGLNFAKFLSIYKKWFYQCQNSLVEPKKQDDSKSKKPLSDETNGYMLKTAREQLPPLNGANNKRGQFSESKDSKMSENENDNYDDDFTSGTTPRTPKGEKKGLKARGPVNSDDEIEENISYVEESSKIDEVTIDQSISTLQGNNDADYIEDVSI